ncbi:hypothetical protein [Cetobacterium sp.]|uniref:hypothetical protein n=1 Tax=Cetobacterium sp. TaxID=2071632 RepID=UPI003F415B8D
MSKIVAIFSNNNFYTKEKIKNFESLQRQFVDLEVLESFQKKELSIANYKVVIDCTDSNNLYNKMLEQKKGKEISDRKTTYLLTPSGKIVLKAPSTNKYFSAEFNDSETVRENVKKVFEEYNKAIEFAYSKIDEIKNLKIFNKGIEVGIDITDFIDKKIGETKYKLVLEIPENKEINTEYITPEQISIIKDFLSIRGAIIR